MRPILQLSITLALMALSTTTLAHPGHDTAGLTAGLLHPVMGMDHLLAMLAIGLWAAQMGGRVLWQVPAAFVVMLGLGGWLGQGYSVPGVEGAIAASLLVFGALVAGGTRIPAWAGMLLAGTFALFHGVAHGNEMPVTAAGTTYALGFLVASLLLQATGGFAVYASRAVPWLTRIAGAAIAMSGAVLLNQL